MKVRAWILRSRSGKTYWGCDSWGVYWSRDLLGANFFPSREQAEMEPGAEVVEVEIRTIEKKGKK